MQGIDMAKEMQKAIVSVGNGMIEKKEVKTAQDFRYVMLENTFLRDTQLFLYPLALVKLALFIMTCYKVSEVHQVTILFTLGKVCKGKVETIGHLSQEPREKINPCRGRHRANLRQ